MFINFQKTFNILFYFIDDPFLTEQCVVQIPIVCMFFTAVFVVDF
jgi:hypothetical protein